MNAERGRGGRRGRGRNSSGHHKDHRSGGRGVYRSNSDGQGTNAVPPGLRVSDTPNQYSTSVPNTSGWDSPSNHQQSGANDQLQAAIQAADRALNVPRQQQGHRGNRDNRRESGGLSSSNPSPGFGQSHSGRGRGSDTVLERESRPGSFGRRSSGTRPAQSNIVAIPQRYVNASNKPFQSPGSTQQATQQGTPNSRHQNGIHSPAVNGRSRRQEHWPQEELQKGFKTMHLFRGVLRVNAGDKTQAYATLKGLSADIFIKGTESQNRSVDGDEVALRILPPCAWWVFKRDQLAAATKAAAEQQEATSRAGFGSASLEVAASPSPICDVGMAEEPTLGTAEGGVETADESVDASGTSATTPMADRSSSLPPVDEDSVFDPISDIQPAPAPVADPMRTVHDMDAGLEPEQLHAQCNDESDSALDTDSVSGIAESPAESSHMQPGSQPSTYSLSTDLMSRLKLDQPLADKSVGPGTTPDSVMAMGSAPSTTLSEFSAVAAPSGPSAQKEGPGNRRQRNVGRSSFGSNRRRSVDNRDNGAPRDCIWHEAENTEAAVEIMNELMVRFPGIRPTAEVVAILNKTPRRAQVVGILRAEGLGDVLRLTPCDPRMPHMMVNASSMPAEMQQRLLAEARDASVPMRTLVSAHMTTWAAGSAYPVAEIRSSMGQAGELEAETAALLAMEKVSDVEFTPEVLACLPKANEEWSISPDERAQRIDFTGIRLFSIDPPTARDLDDALSIQPLPGGNFRVGVHIADVAHFVSQGNALDEEAKARGTSVYLVQRVIPMLPRLLCEKLCSLNSGVERLAFSVTWDMTPEGHILSQWAGRSIIKSCAKLAYGHAQDMIEGSFQGLPDQDAPPVELHGCTWPEVVQDVLALNSIARHLKSARADNGALRLDNTKLFFKMDEHGNPVSAGPYVQREANQLVEEFMLLANMTVAKIVADAFPDRALLRRHPPPDTRKLLAVLELAKSLDISMDVTTAGSIAQSLRALREGCTDHAVMEVVTLMVTKPMQIAEYFCTGQHEDTTKWRHYALAVSHYTHFTSPIRRYPDVVVHRLLAAALRLNPALTQPPPDTQQHPPQAAPTQSGMSENSSMESSLDVTQGHQARGKQADARQMQNKQVAALSDEYGLVDGALVSETATHCNERKLAAKTVSDGSMRLYLCVLLRQHPIITQGVCLQIGGSKFIEVYISELGMDRRIQLDTLQPAVVAAFDKDSKQLLLSQADQTPSRGSRPQGGSRNSLPQTADSTPSSSNQDTMAASAAHSSGSVHQGQVAGIRHSDSGEHEVANSASPESWSQWPCLNGLEFLENLRNPENLQPVALPLELKLFSRVPVVVSARLFGQTGMPSEAFARLLIK